MEQINNKCEYYALQGLLEFCGSKTLCEFTVWRWMKSLGCEFNEQNNVTSLTNMSIRRTRNIEFDTAETTL